MPKKPNSFFGYSLIELLTVVGILAILSAVIAPNLASSTDQAKLESSAKEVLHALRYAQSRSESSGLYTAVRIQTSTRIEVLEVDELASPPEPSTTQIIHPLTKRPYLITLSDKPSLAGISFDATDGPFVHSDSSTTEFLFFDPRGRPYVVSSSGIGLLAATNLSITLGSLKRNVTIDNISGRVRIEEP